MNTPDFEHPSLTACALGELSPAEAARVRHMIATSPALRAEYARIEKTVAAMRNAPPAPRRALAQRQRETVLAMGQSPSRNPKAVPFAYGRVRTPSAAWGFAKFAAAACLAIGAFVLGQNHAPRTGGGEPADVRLAGREPAAPVSVATPAPEVVSAQVKAPAPRSMAPAPDADSFEVVRKPPRITPVLAVGKSTPAVTPTVVAEQKMAAAPIVAPRPVVAPANALKSFTAAAAQPESTISLQPQLMRVAAKPVPREFAGQILAAPLPDKPKPAARNSIARKPEPQPQLLIHSWKAEIASCPWDTSRRLMRFVAQIPVDQDGIENNARDYQISVKFDPSQVQAWRLITEKHMPPSNGGQLATRFAWYEIIPGRNFAAKDDKPATIGTLDIIQPRGAGHDSQPLKLVDRGLAWNDAREDFVFETAMVGFNLLLQGTENIGNLNHKLVLDLAEQSKDDDPKGERGKFISIVRQAQRAAGL